MRLAGANPVMIHRIDKPDDRFPVTDHHFQIALPGDSCVVYVKPAEATR